MIRSKLLTIGAIAAALVAAGASPAAAQYGPGTPQGVLPPLPSTAVPPNAQTAAANQAGVAGAVGGGDATPADNTTSGEGVAAAGPGATAPAVAVVSDERAAPAAASGDLPFTGADIGIFAAIGAALLALGLAVRRRSGLPTAKP
jgi:hypothetical protein